MEKGYGNFLEIKNLCDALNQKIEYGNNLLKRADEFLNNAKRKSAKIEIKLWLPGEECFEFGTAENDVELQNWLMTMIPKVIQIYKNEIETKKTELENDISELFKNVSVETGKK